MKKKNKLVINKKSNDIHPGDQASLLSQIFFWWQLPLVIKHKSGKMTENDFQVVLKEHNSKILGEKFEHMWAQEMIQNKKPSLLKAITKLVLKKYLVSGFVLFIIDTTATFIQPLYLGKLLEYFTPDQRYLSKFQACIYGFVIIFSTSVRVLAFQFLMLKLYILGIKMRTACSAVIFRKILKSNAVTVHKVTLGKLINLLTTDVEKFDKVLTCLQCAWMAVVKVIAAVFLLYFWCGYPAVAGVCVLLVFNFLQWYMFEVGTTQRKNVANKTDYRLRIMNGIISGIQAIKMYSWEKPFSKMVKQIRREELQLITKSNQLQNTNFTIVLYVHRVSIYFFLLLLLLGGYSLNPQMVFTTINIYDLLKQAAQFGVAAINVMADSKATIDRIEQFLILEDNNSHTVIKKPNHTNVPKNKIFAEKICVKWNSSLSNNTLTNVDFKVPESALVAVVGHVGSGKSTLLQAILKEAPLQSGNLFVEGLISYAPQEPWVFPATIRENIIFSEKPDDKKLSKVIKICALEQDICLFPNGENTFVGERGVMLSGGQKARVSLARAVYRDADFYLLDDPLSAVDSSVAYQIFTECFLGYLKNKSVVLVTHQLRFLQNMDLIYVLEHGEVKSCGKYEEIESLVGKSLQKYQEQEVDTNASKIRTSFIESEVKEDTGNENINPYKRYLLAGGHWILICFYCALFILSQFFMNVSDAFISFWINLEQGSFYDNQKFLNFFTDFNCLYVYTGLTLIVIILYHLTSWTFVKACKNCSVNLHDPLLKKSIRGTMAFFNIHSSGRIINRFSRDMSIIDEITPKYLYQFIRQVTLVVGVFILAVAVNFWIILPTIVICFVVYILMKVFLPTMNWFKYLGAGRRSPLLTLINSSIQGLTTIKASHAETFVLEKFNNYHNSQSAVDAVERSIYFSYAFWIDTACTLYIAVIIFMLLIFQKDTLAGNVGLIITQSLLLIGTVQYMTRSHGEVESQMTSVKRVVEYSDLVSEDDTSTYTPLPSWPTQGTIKFDSVSMRYSNDKPYILKQVTLEIQGGEKIGIIGRTGSGKSSLISTLFRLYDFEGTILIDNIDVKTVALSTLRSKLSIIPQDPILFLGTLRTNLDPFEQFSDSELWSALEDVELKNVVANLPMGLDSPVLEGGANYSVGQKQMICLVRAVLRNSRIVVFDEATAKIDLETDKLIQATIRRKFKKSTILMIAHRLDTVLDSDKILVMDKGSVVEFDTKEKLLENIEGYFYKYVYHT